MEVRTSPKPASLGSRVVAAILDSAVISVVWYAAIKIWGEVEPASRGVLSASFGDTTLTGTPAVLLVLATAAFWILPEWLLGATLGKWACDLRVTTLTGGTISFGQALKRNVLRIIDCFPFYLTGFITAKLTPRQQRLGDLWARTIVIPKETPVVLSSDATLNEKS